MNKIRFFNFFKEEDEYIIASIWNDITLCLEINYPITSDKFYSIHILDKLSSIIHLVGLKFKCFGLNESSERKSIVFFPLDFSEDEFIPDFIYLKIDAQNRFKTLQHKDFLGTILSLGLKRELIGDIIVKNNVAYSITNQKIYDILLSSLNKINTIPVKITSISKQEIPETEFKEFVKNIASLRLDSIVATLANVSRSLANELIEKGDVSLNFNVEKSKNKFIDVGTIITIRKVGKFRIDKLLGETKKDRLKLNFKQYI